MPSQRELATIVELYKVTEFPSAAERLAAVIAQQVIGGRTSEKGRPGALARLQPFLVQDPFKAPTAKGAPKPQGLDRSRELAQALADKCPVNSGQLAEDFLTGRIKITMIGPDRYEIDASGAPSQKYAEIQDVGGEIAAHTQPEGAGPMVWKSGGKTIFAMSRGPIEMPAHFYTAKAAAAIGLPSDAVSWKEFPE